MKDYSGLLEIAEASIGKNDDDKLRSLKSDLQATIQSGSEQEQQAIADQMGERILELL